MIRDEKILITGITGMVAEPLAGALAQDNEVWGVARFANPEARIALEEAGVTTRALDLGAPDFSDLPADFTYVLHLGWMRAGLSELQAALRTNVEGPGLLSPHPRGPRPARVTPAMATFPPPPAPCPPHPKPTQAGRAAMPSAPPAPATRAGIGAVARFWARAFDMPIVIARLNTWMGGTRSYPAQIIRSVLAGEPIRVPHDPHPQTPIHADDMIWQLEALLDAAATPARIVNWCGDETLPIQDWARMAGEWSGMEPRFAIEAIPGAPPGSASDPTLRQSITGPSRVNFADALRRLSDDIAHQEEPA